MWLQCLNHFHFCLLVYQIDSQVTCTFFSQSREGKVSTKFDKKETEESIKDEKEEEEEEDDEKDDSESESGSESSYESDDSSLQKTYRSRRLAQKQEKKKKRMEKKRARRPARTYSPEPEIYAKRTCRSRNNVSYRFQEFDELISSAIQDEKERVAMAEKPVKPPGKAISIEK